MATKSHAERVAANVRAEMARHRVTQSTLAKKLHCSQQALSRRINGRYPFDVNELGVIADVLGIGFEDLVLQSRVELSV
ncbi:helix-turn-helix domain-containing protein [Rhodococcus hoagii]|nr:helix-turn-helix domain-containing protein [Prescottella equi]MBM4592268.1 helix-turn-helix domain-containing protein [Prescottella equi]MBM4596134.1 helix-turn-helix domain-containing protein [Prescottella equi]NKV08556.1 helix-turn-helix domain-containing protein [Prescottella equi]NKV08581.1 helix-turn-helix domain-containing protein [Prescottella equi]